jgi:hypothetical protein
MRAFGRRVDLTTVTVNQAQSMQLGVFWLPGGEAVGPGRAGAFDTGPR